MSTEIGLSEFISKIKEDLKPIQESPIFFLEKAELEIHVTASKEASLEGEIKGKADLKINVLGFDLLKLGEGEVGGKASGKLQRQDVHTIKAILTPLLSKEEMMSTLGEEELNQIKEGVKRKIMRGDEEEDHPSLSGERSKKESSPQKVMRG